MGFERRRNGEYLYTKERIGDRVISRYMGSGDLALMFALLDDERKEERREKAAVEQRSIDELRAMNDEVSKFCREVDQVLAAVLEAAGYHNHKRGEWRKRRAQ